MIDPASWNRREFVSAAALLGLALGVPGCVTANALDQADAPSDRQLAMLTAVAQIVLPRTDTLGAGDAGVGAFVALALAHGLDGTRAPLNPAARTAVSASLLRPDGSLRYVDWLDAQLGESWLAQTEAAQLAAVAALDASAFAAGADAHPWRKVKALILTGYYTSREGGSQELQYAAIPGRFDPRVPVGPDARGFSSDWTGVDFG